MSESPQNSDSHSPFVLSLSPTQTRIRTRLSFSFRFTTQYKLSFRVSGPSPPSNSISHSAPDRAQSRKEQRLPCAALSRSQCLCSSSSSSIKTTHCRDVCFLHCFLSPPLPFLPADCLRRGAPDVPLQLSHAASQWPLLLNSELSAELFFASLFSETLKLLRLFAVQNLLQFPVPACSVGSSASSRSHGSSRRQVCPARRASASSSSSSRLIHTSSRMSTRGAFIFAR